MADRNTATADPKATTETASTGEKTSQQKYHERQKALQALTQEQLETMISKANDMDPAIKELVLNPLIREKDRREHPSAGSGSGGGAAAREARVAAHKEAMDLVEAALAEVEGSLKDVTIILGFDSDGKLIDKDIKGRMGPKVRAKLYMCEVNKDGEVTSYEGTSLKDLIVKVFPDTAKRKAMNKSGYFRSRGIDVFAVTDKGERVLVNPINAA